MADLAVSILFHEKADQTIKCIKSFLPSDIPIYVLNNASSQSSRDALGKYCKRYGQVKIFDSEKNLGVAVGRNYLIEHTREEWLLFVDNDIYVKTDDWLEKVVKHIGGNPSVEVFIPKLFNVHENAYSHFKSMRIEGEKAYHDVEILDRRTNTFPGGASFVKRTLFQRLGFYDDQMFVGFEDFEYAIRGIKINEPVNALLINDIILVHDHQQQTKMQDKGTSMKRYDYKVHLNSYNRIYDLHGLHLEMTWEAWLDQQRDKVSGKRSYMKEIVWKRWTPIRIKKVIRRIRSRLRNR